MPVFVQVNIDQDYNNTRALLSYDWQVSYEGVTLVIGCMDGYLLSNSGHGWKLLVSLVVNQNQVATMVYIIIIIPTCPHPSLLCVSWISIQVFVMTCIMYNVSFV